MMKKLLLFCFAVLSFSNLIAQSTIKGTVMDKDTRKPIQDVIVQFGEGYNDYVYTNDKGAFILPAGDYSVIHIQFFGYKPKSVSISSLSKNDIVFLESNPISLPPIVISPDEADDILEKVMINTKKKLVSEVPLGYLLHFNQSKLSDTLKNEIYLSYTTSVSQKDLNKKKKDGKVPYKYNIIDIRRLQSAPVPTTELYGAEYHASYLFSFGKSVNNETKRSYSSDSTLIILEIKPLEGKNGWAEGELVIDKKDMTLISMEVTSIDSLMEAQPYKKYMDRKVKVLQKTGRFEFSETHGKLYMNESYTYYKFAMTDDYGGYDEVEYHCDVNFTGFVKQERLRNRKLSGFCQELFYFPDSTTKEFWRGEQDETIYISDAAELDEAFVKSTYAKHKKMSNIIKAAIPPLTIFGLFILIF